MAAETHHHEPSAPRGWDGLGLILSGLCVVHCLATPLLVSLLPLAIWIRDEKSFHLWLAAILIPVGLIAFIRGYKRHSQAGVLAGGFAGFFLLALGILWPEAEHSHAPLSMNIWFTVGGSLALVYSHWRNWQYSRCMDCVTLKPRIQQPMPDGLRASATGRDSAHPHSQV